MWVTGAPDGVHVTVSAAPANTPPDKQTCMVESESHDPVTVYSQVVAAITQRGPVMVTCARILPVAVVRNKNRNRCIFFLIEAACQLLLVLLPGDRLVMILVGLDDIPILVPDPFQAAQVVIAILIVHIKSYRGLVVVLIIDSLERIIPELAV